MAPRDYVTRKRTTSGRSRALRKTPLKNKASRIILVLSSVLGLLLVFGSTLYVLKQKKFSRTPSVLEYQTARPSALPTKPQERWRYIQELENKQIEINPKAALNRPSEKIRPEQRSVPLIKEGSLPSQSAHSNKLSTVTAAPNLSVPRFPTAANNRSLTTPLTQQWLLQCGPFRRHEQAEALRAKLALLGIESRMNHDQHGHQVLIGPYTTRASMHTKQQQLRQANINHCSINLQALKN